MAVNVLTKNAYVVLKAEHDRSMHVFQVFTYFLAESLYNNTRQSLKTSTKTISRLPFTQNLPRLKFLLCLIPIYKLEDKHMFLSK